MRRYRLLALVALLIGEKRVGAAAARIDLEYRLRASAQSLNGRHFYHVLRLLRSRDELTKLEFDIIHQAYSDFSIALHCREISRRRLLMNFRDTRFVSKRKEVAA